MEMQVNRRWIRVERERRAWSQEHLAVVAGVGVRTIQRVESTGIASNETAKALAAVFECTLDALRVDPTPVPQQQVGKANILRALAAGAAFVVATGTLWMVASNADAGEFKLDIALAMNCAVEGNTVDCGQARSFTLVAKDGETAEARVEGELRIVLTPRQADNGTILVSAEIYRFDGQQYSLWAKPSVVAKNGENATLNLTGGDGNVYMIAVRPSAL